MAAKALCEAGGGTSGRAVFGSTYRRGMRHITFSQPLPGKHFDPRSEEKVDIRLPNEGLRETPDSGNQFSVAVLPCGSEYFSGELERGFS